MGFVPRGAGVLRRTEIAASRQQGKCVGDGDDDQQAPVAREQRRILEQASHDGAEHVGAEGHGRLVFVAEAVGEDQAGGDT